MTATLERWWTPAGQISVDQLLKSGPDAQKDFGIALMALHRAGAEACELVAKTAVADEVVLVSALAETRALLAPAAVEVISKSVGGPQYAGLLLKDVLDDAEIAALALYRTCMAKNVAPPIAAERVGAVYGVNSRGMSKYASLASDPKANPRAVADLADRTLFDFVSKVVSEEYVGVKETVSKAPVRDYHGREPGERDAEGQFARVRTPQTQTGDGVDLNALFAEAEAREATPAAPKQVATPPKGWVGGPQVGRPKRQARQKRKSRPVETPQQSSPGQSAKQTYTQQTYKQSALGQKYTRQQAAAQKFVSVDDAPLPMGGHKRAVPKLNLTSGNYVAERTDKAVSFVLPADEFNAVVREAGDIRGRHVMRLGPLEEYAGDARLYDDGSGQIHEHHQAGVEHILDMLHSKVDVHTYGPARVGTLSLDVLRPEEAGADKRLAEAKKAFLEKMAEAYGYQINVASEITNVRTAPRKDDPSQMALVWRPPVTDRSGRRVQSPPLPHVVEMVVPKGVRGQVAPGGRVKIDGSTAMSVVGLWKANVETEERVTTWDPELGAFRTVVVMQTAAENDIHDAKWPHSKAATPDNPRTRYYDARNESGEFTRTGELQRLFDEAKQREVKMANPTTPGRRARPRRMSRQVRQVEVTPQSAKQTVTAQSATQNVTRQDARQRLQQHVATQQKVRQKLKEHPGSDLEGLLFLDTAAPYTVLRPWQMERLIKTAGFEGWVQDGAEIDVSPSARLNLLELPAEKGDAADLQVNFAGIETWAKAQGHDTAESFLVGSLSGEKERTVLHHTFTDIDEIDDVAGFLAQKLNQDPTLEMLRTKFVTRKDGRVDLIVTGNVEQLPEVHVVNLDDVVHVDDITKLTAGRTYRTQNKHSISHWLRMTWFGAERFGGMAEEIIPNPTTRLWHAE